MLDEFLSFVNEQQLARTGGRVLLAVSGGIDSVVMCELFKRAGYEFAIAHCNFQLRGDESEGDEQFVKALAKQYDVAFFVKRFDTKEEATKESGSVQMAARRLRYEWFEELRSEENFDLIATAHHRNDEVETFFINLVRGTGIAGLRGIPARNGHVIRPLLFALRSDIEAFANQHNLKWRDDSSNLSPKYLRNKIRQDIIPALKEINPSIENILSNDIRRIREAFLLMEAHIEEKRKDIFKHDGNNILISIEQLKALQPLNTYLFEFLKPYNFREPVVHEIAEALDSLAGKQFYSPTHRLLKDRKELIITLLNNENYQPVRISAETQHIDEPFQMHIATIEKELLTTLRTPPTIAYLDKAKLQFPLSLRKWQQGDHFYPLGMKNRKKLSDLFIDNKFSIAQKEDTWVLVSGNDIVWVVGVRPDDRYRVTDNTKEVLSLELANFTNKGTFEA